MANTRARTVVFGPSKTGLDTVGYALINADDDKSTYAELTTDGVGEVYPDSGIYGALVTVPDRFQGWIVWDTGEGTITAEEINPLKTGVLSAA
jgi:hypothetical protein